MRKFKLLSVVAAVLVMTMAFSSCALVGSGFNKVFNKDFDVTADVYTNAKQISELDGYNFTGNSNEEFAVFQNGDSIVVFSFRNAKIVYEKGNSENITYAVNFVAGAPVFCIAKTVIGETEATVTNTYYDATGDSFCEVEAEKEVGAPSVVGDEIVIINAKAYTFDDESGTVEEKGEVPAYIATAGFTDFTDKYYYVLGNTVVIYDEDFIPTATWTAPSYINGAVTAFALNNGNVFIQYQILLDEDAKDYDYYDATGKFDLVSLILTPKGKVKNLNIDYLVTNVTRNDDIYDKDAEKADNQFTSKFENIARVVYIEDKRIDQSVNGVDFVLLNNNGKIQGSLKLVDGQTGMPTKIAENLFTVPTLYGTAIVNAKGKVQFTVTANVNVVGQNIIAGNAIYNLKFDKVYDLSANKATVLTTMDDTVLVQAGEEDKYSIIAFCNGEQEPIYKFDAEAEKNKGFQLVNDVGYLITDDDAEHRYNYYASNGKSLVSLDDVATIVVTGYEDTMLISTVKDGVTIYYAVTK